ncbi:MAG: NAD-dependent dehydratase [Chloroflexi bacterium]|nr:MAG: NAD-dependent dehydratase [Chloroflexota bacterium]
MAMSEANLQVILGASGGVGGAVARELVRQGAVRVRGVTRSGKGDVPTGVEMVAGDVGDTEQMRTICEGASIIYFCANPPYTDWQRAFPPLLEGAIAGARASGAKLIVTDNLYVYAPTTAPLTEDLPWRPVTRKGRVRAAMDERLMAAHQAGEIRMAIGRASDFFGPGGLNTALIGERFFEAFYAGKAVDWVGRLDVPHTCSYVEDFGRGLVTLGQHDEALGQAWHIPAADPLITGRQFLDLVFEAAGKRARIRTASKGLLRVAGLWSPMLREMAEMAYEFEQPYHMDGSKFTRAFGGTPTSLREAVQSTVAWFQRRLGVAET